ncbi:hypothetical protein [Ochrovirga pacifica]|uniref:hypothetical protein n=1 Tax=Ochrovirga pacifica TaxID=1042376 RepID=UPI000255954B|nr:hypothetical protein [Ochrovirga pacifica]
MNTLVRINKNTNLSILIILLWTPFLFFDSTYFSNYYFDGKVITTLCVLVIDGFLLYTASLRLKIQILLMIPLSWLGEHLFCNVWDMYDYRAGTIPLYVPFGHAGVFAFGWLLTQKYVTKHNSITLKRSFTIFYALAFFIVITFFKDTLSMLLGALFFWALKRKKFLPFYLIMGTLVLYLELAGTYLQVWTWSNQQGFFTTTNPPLGAIFLYVGGDMTLNKLTRFLLKLRRKKKLRHKKSLISNTDKA